MHRNQGHQRGSPIWVLLHNGAVLWWRTGELTVEVVTFLHGVIDRLKAMRGPAEAASPSRMENPTPMGVIGAGLSPMRLLEEQAPGP